MMVTFSGNPIRFDQVKPSDAAPGQIIKVDQPNDPFDMSAGGTRYFLVAAVAGGQVFGTEVSDVAAACKAAYSQAETFEVIA